SDFDMRRAAISGLGSMGPDAVPLLLRALGDADPQLRWEAVAHLGLVEPEPADVVPALSEALRDSSPHVRIGAAEVPGRVARPPDAVPALISLLAHEDRDTRRWAACTLGRIGPPAKAAAPALRATLHDAQEDVRDAAIEALQKMAAELPEVVCSLVVAMQHGEPAARLHAIRRLGGMGPRAQAAGHPLLASSRDMHCTHSASAASS